MSRDFRAFIEACKPTENVKYVASKRICDENGKPIEWEVRAITQEENVAIRKRCMKKEPIPGRKGFFNEVVDAGKYTAALVAACTVFPPVNDKDFQDQIGVMNGSEAVQKILLAGEYDDYNMFILQINGFDQDMDDLTDEAKN